MVLRDWPGEQMNVVFNGCFSQAVTNPSSRTLAVMDDNGDKRLDKNELKYVALLLFYRHHKIIVFNTGMVYETTDWK